MRLIDDDHRCEGWKGEMAERICAFDWSTTELGALESWSQSLRSTVQTLLASPLPHVLLWGRLGYMVYNDAYAEFAGGRHPSLLGSPVEYGWPEVAAFNRHIVETCLAGGTLSFRDKELVLLRTGRPEKVWVDLYYSPVADDTGTPTGVLAVVVETTERINSERHRRDAEAAFRAANERLQLALNAGAVLGTFVWDMKTNLLSGDERFARTFSYPVEHFEQGLPIEVATKIVHPDDLERVNSLIERTVKYGDPYRAEYRIKRPDGSYLWILASGRRDVDAEGVPHRFPGVLIDIHERKMAEESLRQLTQHLEQRVADAIEARSAAEEQLRQAQKLEAIGALTGGVAHDFNNVLQVISGNLQLLALKAPNNDFVQGRVSAADNAVQRGAKLASQLLAFARRQPLSPAVLNPRNLLAELDDLLQRTLGETITVEMAVPEKPWLTLVDRNQLENALINLAINARDAMHGDGVIAIDSENVVLGQQYCADKDIVPGDYVRLSVSDTGAGMSPEVAAHAFEPFFTTKPEGHGTGLGLSMVFGFVKQSGGHTEITSVLGKGTVVSMYFPRSDAAESMEATRSSSHPAGGQETILVVEDDINVRETVVELLQTLGYTTLAAANGDAALHALKSGAAIDLVFSDVVMPGEVKSADLAAWADAQSPSIPVLFTSGHTRDILSRDGILGPDVHLLSKPYRPDALTAMIRKVLSTKLAKRP